MSASVPADTNPTEYLLDRAWVVIANAGLHNGGWESETPEWVAAAERWRDDWQAHVQLRGNPKGE